MSVQDSCPTDSSRKSCTSFCLSLLVGICSLWKGGLRFRSKLNLPSGRTVKCPSTALGMVRSCPPKNADAWAGACVCRKVTGRHVLSVQHFARQPWMHEVADREEMVLVAAPLTTPEQDGDVAFASQCSWLWNKVFGTSQQSPFSESETEIQGSTFITVGFLLAGPVVRENILLKLHCLSP